MKIKSLHIRNFRGIAETNLTFNQKSVLLFGENGVGKSTVVDALDFLITGSVSRMTGAGTGQIDELRHIPHGGCAPESVAVSAEVVFSNGQSGLIRRALSDREHLDYPADLKSLVEEMLVTAKLQQHLLTRRDLLRFISVAPSERAKQVQALLNWSRLEATRITIGKLQRDAKDAQRTARKASRELKQKIAAIVGIDKFGQPALLKKINESRRAVGAIELDVVDRKSLTFGINATSEQHRRLDAAYSACERLFEELSVQREVLLVAGDEIRRAGGSAINDIGLATLLQSGSKLIPEDGSCPLCTTAFAPHELARILAERLAFYQASLEQHRLREAAVRRFAAGAELLKSRYKVMMQSMADEPELSQNVDELSKKSPAWHDVSQSVGVISNFGDDESVLTWIETISDRTTTASASINALRISGDRSAHIALLFNCASRLADLEESEGAEIIADTTANRADLISVHFEAARSELVSEIYDKIASRFAEHYRSLHDSHESGFTAELDASGAALNLEVDFHGRGLHPPIAMHSEGHQDSMGLCMFFALREYLTQKSPIDVIILDDVVMSVDAEHRRAVSKLLCSMFPDRQLVVTTHDRVWAQHLCQDGVIDKRTNRFDFHDWEIGIGPQIELSANLFERVQGYLDNSDVHHAAFALRRGLEHFFANLCSDLGASVRYVPDGRNTLADFINPALSKLSDHVKLAKTAAVSWRQPTETLEAFEKHLKAARDACQCDQWELNTAVHFDRWHELSLNDLRPLVAAYRDMFALLECVTCGTGLRLSYNGMDAVALQCACKAVMFNLEKKPKAAER
jgi:energy-coupling factor transporter ATP-binding protein EcfA2